MPNGIAIMLVLVVGPIFLTVILMAGIGVHAHPYDYQPLVGSGSTN